MRPGYEENGGREGIRTLDLSVANAALSQLSYAPRPCGNTWINIARLAERDNLGGLHHHLRLRDTLDILQNIGCGIMSGRSSAD